MSTEKMIISLYHNNSLTLFSRKNDNANSTSIYLFSRKNDNANSTSIDFEYQHDGSHATFQKWSSYLSNEHLNCD